MREFPVPNSAAPGPRKIYSVAGLNRSIRDMLETELPEIWVEGEISNLSRPPSGHIYFTLKDQNAQIRCALFRSRVRRTPRDLADGAHMLVRARVTFYEARGDAQLIVQFLEPAGEGLLLRAFEALKRKLKEEGLFDEAHKRALPALPRRVGVITSPTGAAVRDILSTFKRRFPGIPILVYPVLVQGVNSEHEIIRAINTANQDERCDVLILARGGGSLEDLQSFNSEAVARAVFESRLPVVCGVGHEVDFSICDYVADKRAATPTAAAELVSPNREDWLTGVEAAQRRLLDLMLGKLERRGQHVDWLGKLLVHPRERLKLNRNRMWAAMRILNGSIAGIHTRKRLSVEAAVGRLWTANPRHGLREKQLRAKQLHQQLRAASSLRVGKTTDALSRLLFRLDHSNPLRTLERGFAIVSEHQSQKVIRTARNVTTDQRVDVRMTDGLLVCRVEKTRDIKN